MNLRNGAILLMILAAAATRLLPHEYNLSAIGAICLFGGANFSKKWQALLLPILAVVVSDLVLNKWVYTQIEETSVFFYDGWYWQYLSYIAIVGLGYGLLQKVKPMKVILGALGATVLFYLVSNFGTWYSTNLYPKDAAGLAQCMIAGIPFIKGTLTGDLVYSVLLFGSLEFLQNNVPALKKATA
jgi:hypothetical protein